VPVDVLGNADRCTGVRTAGKGTYEPRPVEVRFDAVTNREPDMDEGLPGR